MIKNCGTVCQWLSGEGSLSLHSSYEVIDQMRHGFTELCRHVKRKASIDVPVTGKVTTVARLRDLLVYPPEKENGQAGFTTVIN